MKDFNIYGFGGTGINILNKYATEGKNSSFIDKVVGADTSDANPVDDNGFIVERLPGAFGSGGNRGEHRPEYADFTKQLMAKHAPNKINILVYSLGGGTGSSLAPYVHRFMLQNEIPCISLVIGDTSTVNEQKNTIDTLGSLYNQCKVGHPVVFSYLENKKDKTQGEINLTAVNRIDNAIMLLNLMNNRIDYKDIHHLFFYNKVVEADPILTQMTFLTENDVPNYALHAVAAISLYPSIDDIRIPFENMLYRKAGLFGEKFIGAKSAVHAVLDHGDTVEKLKEMISEKETRVGQMSGQFKAKNEKLFAGAADDDGMI